MKKLLALTLVGTLISTASCGYNTASNKSLKSTKTSAYNTRVTKDNGKYVPSTYSANRVKYYDGLTDSNYNTYTSGQDYMYNYGYTDYNNNYTNNTYKDSWDSTSAKYLKNPYMYSNNYYKNDTYRDLSTKDFNNGLITYDQNSEDVTISPLTTNALNTKINTRLDTTDYTIDREDDVTMNKVNYEMSNTYEDIKDATKNVVNDVSRNTKKMAKEIKKDVKKAAQNMEY